MKYNIIGLVALYVVSLAYTAVRVSGFYVPGGGDIDAIVLAACLFLLPYFLSRLAKRKLPYLLLIVFLPIIFYVQFNNESIEETQSSGNGEYLIAEKVPMACCGRGYDFQSKYVLYKKVKGSLYKKEMTFTYASRRFGSYSEQPAPEDIERFINDYIYRYGRGS